MPGQASWLCPAHLRLCALPRLPSRYFFQRFAVFDYAMSIQLPRIVQLLAEQAERENVLVRPSSRAGGHGKWWAGVHTWSTLGMPVDALPSATPSPAGRSTWSSLATC